MKDAPFGANPGPGNVKQLKLATMPYNNEHRQYFGMARILDSCLCDIKRIPTSPSDDFWGFFKQN